MERMPILLQKSNHLFITSPTQITKLLAYSVFHTTTNKAGCRNEVENDIYFITFSFFRIITHYLTAEMWATERMYLSSCIVLPVTGATQSSSTKWKVKA